MHQTGTYLTGRRAQPRAVRSQLLSGVPLFRRTRSEGKRWYLVELPCTHDILLSHDSDLIFLLDRLPRYFCWTHCASSSTDGTSTRP